MNDPTIQNENASTAAAAVLPAAPYSGRIDPAISPKDPIIALLLNLLFYVIGYFYIGQWKKAITFLMIPFLYLAFTAATCGIALVALPSLFAIPAIVWIDVYLQAKQLQQGRAIDQWTFFGDYRA